MTRMSEPDQGRSKSSRVAQEAPVTPVPSGVERLVHEGCLRVGHAQRVRAFVRHREKPPDTPGDRVLGHRRNGERPQFFEAGLLVGEPEFAGLAEVVGLTEAERRVRKGYLHDLSAYPTGEFDLVVALGALQNAQ